MFRLGRKMKPLKLYGEMTGDLRDASKGILGGTSDMVESAQQNIENMLGAIQIPLGVAGQIPIKGDWAQGEYVIPMATTEACLVASVNRGVKILRENGGCIVKTKKIGISRAPVLRVKKVCDIKYYQQFLRDYVPEMQAIVRSKSQHLKLLEALPSIDPVTQELYIHFRFDSCDAMGMNMATIATKAICNDCLEPHLDAQLIAISSNLCSDKKPAAIHTQIGRGYHVQAQVDLKITDIEKIFHCDADAFIQVYESKLVRGSKRAGSIAQNAHHANIVAAIFAATGQDLAHVVEGSHGKTEMQRMGDQVRVLITMPALVCGTVGGGTKVAGQRHVIDQVMGLKQPAGEGAQAAEFAEVVAAATLAGEISLLGAIAAQNLAEVHDRFRK